MRALVVIAVLAGCESKPRTTAPPTLESIDRSCQVDADCTISGTVSCCGNLCGDFIGEAVNARAWSEVAEDKEKRCKGVECPQAKCEPLPACREVPRAVCTSGRCARVMDRTPACAEQAGDAGATEPDAGAP